MKVKISADSTCDLSQELLEKYQVTIAPLSVIIDGDSHKDGVDVTPENIFRAVDLGKKVQTAAVNQFEYEELFGNLLKENDAVVHFCISREMSSCYSDACEAARKLGNVYVVDSRNLSTGIGLLVLEACELAAMGKSAEEIFNTIEARKEKVVTTFVVQDIGYLYRGGRCSGLEALGAKMLKIRPSIVVHDGKMSPGKKYRGKMDRCIPDYVRDMEEDLLTACEDRVFITHSGCTEETIAAVREYLESLGHFKEIHITRAGAVISSHCGPGTLGVLFIAGK